MTNEQTVVQIMKLDQTGFGGLTTEGKEKLRELMEAPLTKEQATAHSSKERSYLYTRLIRSMDKSRTHA